jgi:hypothetical protein
MPDQEQNYYIALQQQKLNEVSSRMSDLLSKSEQDEPVEKLQDVTIKLLAEMSTRISVIEQLLIEEGRSSPTNLPSSNKVPRIIDLKARDMVSIENLLPVEIADHREFRWSGEDKNITFPVNIDRSIHQEIIFTLVAVVKPQLLEELTVEVDGKQCNHFLREVDSTLQLVAVVKKAPSQKTTIIEIKLPNTYSPFELGESGDNRKLGLAIYSLEVRPIENIVTNLKLSFMG